MSSLNRPPPPNYNWWTHSNLPSTSPLASSSLAPTVYRLPEDGALEVAPLHRNRICHGNQSLLLQSINMLPPGPWGP